MFAVVVSIHVMLLVLTVAGLPAHHQVEARQSSDGCGPNPLVAVISYAREFGTLIIYALQFVILLPATFIQRISVLIN